MSGAILWGMGLSAEERRKQDRRELTRDCWLLAIFFAFMGVILWIGLLWVSGAILVLWGVLMIPAVYDWSPGQKKPPTQESADALTERIRADRREGRERDMEEWDEDFDRLRHPDVSHPSAKASHPPAAPGRGGRMTPEEHEQNLKRTEERAKVARNVFPLRAIIWTWLALMIILALTSRH